MHPQADKGAAVRFAAEHLGVAPEQVMVFGDNSNDLPMFRYAGWPVAMGNGEKCAWIWPALSPRTTIPAAWARLSKNTFWEKNNTGTGEGCHALRHETGGFGH